MYLYFPLFLHCKVKVEKRQSFGMLHEGGSSVFEYILNSKDGQLPNMPLQCKQCNTDRCSDHEEASSWVRAMELFFSVIGAAQLATPQRAREGE